MQVSSFKKSLLASSLLALSTFSQAQQPSMNFAEIGFGQTKVDEEFLDTDSFKGINIAASFEFSDTIYMPITYYKHSDDNNESFINNFGGVTENFSAKNKIDISELSIGLGYKYFLSDSSLIATDISYLNLKFNITSKGSVVIVDSDGFTILVDDQFNNSNSLSADGFALRSVYQNLFDNNIQLNLGLQYKMVREDGENLDDTALILEGVYHITEQWGAKAALLAGEDTQLSLSARYYF